MKLSLVVLYAALAAGLVAGCSRRPKNITPLPSSERVGGGATSLNPTRNPIAGGGDLGNNPTSGRVVPGGSGPNGIDLPSTSTPIGTTPGSESAINKDTSNLSQPDRAKWETWPQDPDILRADVVYFDFDKSVVKRGDASKVAHIAEYLKSHPGYMVKLDGHADERGTEDYNRALGERRALSVRESLLNLGVSQDAVVTATFGEDRPAELGHNEAAWSKNRRVEPVVLIPPGATR